MLKSAHNVLQIHEGVYLSLQPQEIGNISNGYQMITILVNTINQFFPQKITNTESYRRIVSIITNLIPPLNPLILENQPSWMQNLERKQRLEMQIFLRFCLVKLEEKHKSKEVKKEEVKQEYICSKEDIIRLFNQLKFQWVDYDIGHSIQSILGLLPKLQTSGFKYYLIQIIEHFNLEEEFDYLYDNKSVKSIQVKQEVKQEERVVVKQRKDLIKEILGIGKSFVVSERVTPCRSVVKMQNNRRFSFEKEERPAITRTIYHAQKKFFFPKKQNHFN